MHRNGWLSCPGPSPVGRARPSRPLLRCVHVTVAIMEDYDVTQRADLRSSWGRPRGICHHLVPQTHPAPLLDPPGPLAGPFRPPVLLATSRACVIEANGWPFLVTSSGLLGPSGLPAVGGTLRAAGTQEGERAAPPGAACYRAARRASRRCFAHAPAQHRLHASRIGRGRRPSSRGFRSKKSLAPPL